MKRIVTILLMGVLFMQSANAQRYRVRTNQTDSFSIALVKLLNCSIDNFSQCRGDTMGYTEMREYAFKLPINFPGSVQGMLLFGDSRKSAYITFGFCRDRECVKETTRQLIGKIKIALGEQVRVSHEFLSGPDSSFYLSSLGIKDAKGYFADNIEISSTMAAQTKPSDFIIRNDTGPPFHYVRLKIEGGVPDYYHEIHPEPGMRETDLTRTIRELVTATKVDFESLRSSDKNSLTAKEKDTLDLHGYPVYMYYRGSNFSAVMEFPVKQASNTYGSKQNLYKRIIEAAIGTEYVYFESGPSYASTIVYFSKGNADHSPRIYLTLEMTDNRECFRISITSGFYHPVKRNAGLDD